MANHRPTAARRLRTVRKLNKLTQAELARRIGYSAIYVQKIEGRLSDMTEPFAQSVAQVTGVSWNWLLGYTGKDSAPVDAVGLAYDPQVFTSRRRLHADIDLDGFVAGQIHRLCHYLTAALTEAYLKGHYAYLSESVRGLVGRIVEELNLGSGDSYSVSPELERLVFSGDGYAADPGLRESLWRLVSPSAVRKWEGASNGTPADRRYFLKELDSLYELVVMSFVDLTDSESGHGSRQ